MSLIELFIIAVGLSMDAFAVSICKGLSMRTMSLKNAVIVGLYFGGFQGLMPLIGYFLGIHFQQAITSYDHWIAFILLGIIGISMIREALSGEEESCNASLAIGDMLVLAVATSIDALAVGVSFAALEVNVLTSSGIIGITTALTCIVALIIGKRFGSALGEKATIIGGAVLILIGLKSLLL